VVSGVPPSGELPTPGSDMDPSKLNVVTIQL
jgi:hypothetical protein